MALLERVSTLLRANLNDLLAKAEDPEKLAHQLILDMENQLLQVKTQVAIAMADQHALVHKKTEQEKLKSVWLHKAELAVAKQQDDLARSALERSLSHQTMAEGLEQQLADQGADADLLRSTYTRLQQKLTETRVQVDLLTTQYRRNRAARNLGAAHTLIVDGDTQAKLHRLQTRVEEGSFDRLKARTLLTLASPDSLDSLEARFTTLERADRIEALLLELKESVRLPATTQDGSGS